VLQHPDISAHVFPLLEYFDSVREWRTGVTRQSQGIDANALQNQSATAVAQMYSAAQAKMKLIARIFAETGIKDLFQLLHATIRMHGQEAETVRLRNQWVTVDPRDWKERNDLTVKVGLGSGGRSEKLAGLQILAGYQMQALAAGMTNLCDASKIYNTGKELVRALGYKDPDEFWSDPAKSPPAQGQPDPKLMELQMKAQLDQHKMQADQAHQAWKAQADAALAERKAQLDEHLAMIKAQTDVWKTQQEAQLKHQLAQHDLTVKAQSHQLDMAVTAHQAQAGIQVKVNKDAQKQDQQRQSDAKMTKIMKDQSDAHAEQTKLLLQAVKDASKKPKRVRKTKDGFIPEYD